MSKRTYNNINRISSMRRINSGCGHFETGRMMSLKPHPHHPLNYAIDLLCFLCEVPKAPWTITIICREPICRACCNFEGFNCTVYYIESAKLIRYSRVLSQARQFAG
uniref:Interferon regulatory factor 2-binding protein 1/2-like zinc finger domain-containing protein n=1 Tax=Amphimedon queenslandica TaxID=400682 RepID=A0A1X7SMT1_AMPQE